MTDQSNRLLSFIDINPKEELLFNYLIKKTTTSSITIQNIYNGLIAFKIKTNKPDSYIVNPHEGILKEGQKIQVLINMQPREFNPQTDTITDKFLVSAMVFPAGTESRQLSTVLKSTPSYLQQQFKLKVVLKAEGDQSGLDRPSVSTSGTNPRDPNIKITNDEKIKSETNESLKPSQSSILFQNTLSKIEDKAPSSMKITPLREKKFSPAKELTIDIVPPRKFTFGVEKGSPDHVTFLERELIEFRQERDRIKYDLDQNNTRIKAQEQLIAQLSEQKNKLENELTELKNSTFGLRKDSDVEGKEGNTPFEFWHVIAIAITAMILGAFLVK